MSIRNEFGVVAFLALAILGAPTRAQQGPTTRPLPALGNASVSVPWNDLARLIDQSRQEKPPVDFVFAPAVVSAVVVDAAAKILAEVDVTLLGDGYVLVPLGPADAGVTNVSAGDEAAPIVLRDKTLYTLLSGKGKKKLTINAERAIKTDAGVSRLLLPLPPTPLVKLTATLPSTNLLVKASDAAAVKIAEANNVTTVVATYPGGSVASVAWEPRPKEAAKVFALTQMRVSVDRGVLRCRAEVNYEILHAGVDTFRIGLPAGVEFVAAHGTGVRSSQVADENNQKVLIVTLNDAVKGNYALTIDYDARFVEKAAKPSATQPAAKAGAPATRPAAPTAATAAVVVPVLTHPQAAQSRGYIGIEARGGYELIPSADGAERIDVKELPQTLWSLARSPLVVGYRYEAGATPSVSLALARHQDLEVLVAMSDVCEASTTFTPDGKSVTKMMFVVRNNLKPNMAITLPEGAQLWSTFVDDRPVTPSVAGDGRVLIPLKKSDDVEDEDADSYRAKREKRRESKEDELRKMREVQKVQQARDDADAARDLKPYDVEIVFVTPAVKFQNRGQVVTALPKSDVPIGHLSWAVFLPKSLRVVDSEGNLNEVAQFTLPFRHFGEAEWAKQMKVEQQKLAQAAQELAKAQDATSKLAEAAKVQGVLPVRVEIPIVGEIHRFEKFLTVDEMPALTLTYSRKAE